MNVKVIREAVSHRVFLITVSLSVIFLLGSVLAPYWYLYPQISSLIAIPLHYNVHFGVDLFGPPWRVFTTGIVGFSVLLLNTVLAVVFWKTSRILSYGLLCATTLIEIVLAVASAFVTLLVLSYL